MGKARNRAERTGSMDVVIGSTKLVPDGSGDLEVKDASNNRRKIFASEIKLGTGNDIIIIKRNSSTGEAQFQSSSDGGSSTSEQTVGGAGTVTNSADLPITGNQAGDMKLVTSTNNLMIHNGSGWYKIATITNASPTISSAGDGSYNFLTNGTPVSIEIVASDPEGVALQYKYQVTTGSLGSTAAVTNSATSGGTYSALAANTYSNNRFFKVTPSTNEAHAGTFAITFSVTDGINTANSTVSTFTLGFDVGTSVSFNESKTGTSENEYLLYPSQYNLGTADWTIEFWVWFYDFGATSQTSNQNRGIVLIGKNNGGLAIEGYDYNGAVAGRGTIRLLGNNGGHGVVLTGNSRILPRTWYHIAVTNDDSSNTQKLYINGVQDSATGSVSTAFTFSTTETLVGGTWWSNNLQLPFRGYLSNLRVVAGNVYTPSAQTSGSTVFDGTGDYLLTAEDNELVLGTGDFTIEHWIWSADTTNGGSAAQIIDMRKNGSASGSDMYTYVNSSRQYVFGYGSDRITHRGLSNNKWYHIAIVRHNGITTLYMNGEKRNDRGGSNTETWADTTNYTSNQMTVGIHGPDRSSFPFTGKISNLRVTVGTALYTNPLPPDNDVRFDRPLRPHTKVTNTQLLTCQNSTGSITDASDNNVTITAGGNAAADANHPFEAAGNDFTTGLAFDVPTSDLSNIANTKLLTLQEKAPYMITQGSITFDGTGDYVSGVVTAPGTSDFTLECWFNFDATGHKGIVHIGDNAWGTNANGIGFAIKPSIGGYQIYYNDTYTNTSNQGSIPTTGVWYHGAMVRTGGTTKLYINGVETISVSDSKNYASTHIMIGGFYNSGQVMDGKIADLRYVVGTAVYTGAFTPPTGSLTLTGGTYSSTTNVNTSIPSGHTKLLTANKSSTINDDSASSVSLTAVADAVASPGYSGVITKDNSSSAVTATEYNNVAFSYVTPLEHSKGSVRFDGTGDYCAITSSGDLQIAGSNFTVEFWLYLPVAISSNYQVIIGKGHNADNTREWYFEGMSDQKLDFFWSTNGSSWSSAEATPALETNRWYHIVAQRTGSSLKVFTDGAETYANGSFPTIHTGTGVFNIGGYYDGSGLYSNSYISNVRLVKGSTVYTPSGGNGLEFTGSGTTDTASHAGFDFGSNDFTVEFFFKWNSNTGYQTLIDQYYHSSSHFLVQANTSSTKWGVYLNGSQVGSYESSDASQGIWYHYAIVRNGSSFKMYRDGIETISATVSGSKGGTGITKFNHATHTTDGKVSNLRVVKGTAVYTSAGFTIPTANLSATMSGTSLLLFQENSGTTLDDGSTNNVTVTKHSGHNILTDDGPFHKFTVPTDPLGVISNTKLLTCNDSNVINDGSTLNHSTKINGNTIATKFNPF